MNVANLCGKEIANLVAEVCGKDISQLDWHDIQQARHHFRARWLRGKNAVSSHQSSGSSEKTDDQRILDKLSIVMTTPEFIRMKLAGEKEDQERERKQRAQLQEEEKRRNEEEHRKKEERAARKRDYDSFRESRWRW